MSVAQGDSAVLVAVVSANFDFVTEPVVFVTGLPSDVSARVTRVDRGIQLASAVLLIAAAQTALPGAYGLQLHATNAARESPGFSFILTITPRPACTQSAPCVQWAWSATASSQYTPDSWAAKQATGAPNVDGCQDDPKAWASAEPNTREWLEVVFSEAMFATGIELYENYGASSIVSIDVKDDQGTYHTVFSASPGHLSCPSERTIPLTDTSYKVKAVRLNFDQKALNDWNEVDAVGLIGYREK